MEKYVVHYELSNNPFVINNKHNQPKYDMYILKITYNTGEEEKIKLFLEHDIIDIKTIDLERLFGQDGLMKKQGRNDYIFLGELDAQQYFEKVYPRIKEILEQKKESQANSKQVSKNYVCSDIHGMYGSYIKALKQLKPQDCLWILGDAADRGKNGIKIIQDIMERNADDGKKPQVKYILGNHDWLLITVIENMKKYNITNNELINLLKHRIYKETIENINTTVNDDNIIEKIEQYNEKLQELSLVKDDLQIEKNVPLSVIDFIQRYYYDNGGFYTMWEYAKLSEQEQNKIYNFLINSDIFLSQQIGNKKIVLVHNIPPKLKEYDESTQLNLKMTFKHMREKCRESTILDFLQNRDSDEQYEQWRDAGYLTICGHTPLLSEIEDQSESKGFIRIDAGCSMGGALALYCIEDEKTKFLPAKEEYIGQTPDDNDEPLR